MKVPPWMFGTENVFLFCQSDMSVDLGNINRTMSKHFLYISDIHIGLQETGCKGVTEHMRRNMQINGSKSGIFLYHSAYGLVGQRSASLIDKKIPAVINFSPVFLPVFF